MHTAAYNYLCISCHLNGEALISNEFPAMLTIIIHTTDRRNKLMVFHIEVCLSEIIVEGCSRRSHLNVGSLGIQLHISIDRSTFRHLQSLLVTPTTECLTFSNGNIAYVILIDQW